MPRIAKRYLDCVVYIYPNKEAANADERAGGSGFIVARPLDRGGAQTFFLTNRHVIEGVPNPVVRLNRMGGGTELFDTNYFRWKHHPDGDDLSAIQIDVSAEDHDLAWIWAQAFITPQKMSDFLGVGSDVAMLGRFAGVDGKFRNNPTARFGCIAAPDTTKEKNFLDHDQETLLVECHSMPGYSGSPVIAYFPSNALSETALERSGLGPWLLGIDWMHFHDHEPVRKKDGSKEPDKTYVHANSGLAGIIPAWRIPPLLDLFSE